MIYRLSSIAAWVLKCIVNGCILALLMGIGVLLYLAMTVKVPVW